ncbi:hypothetical protein HYH03_008431 [Edaphochlamys debaryana]|uniref:FCP1 homology domain-containing protein n=1 Tax=Edaphochlamys debaryana TaxID=47281 RepID=A0A835Y6C6_9CHLO|nr:hypothetical protein HYH03_008431 [Edaphochlamys debaryana]|eukprot:KAG2493295.1 hypothetical protein HYH03_008431 [Edaphochlamys debaryana]
MTTIVDDCPDQCLHTSLYDALRELHGDEEELCESGVPCHADAEVSAADLSLAIDESNGAAGAGGTGSLPATPAERPCTFSPAALPLPPSTSGRATLVLDLDGTLISSEEVNALNSAFLWNPPAGARQPDYEAMGRRVWLRPGVREFLAAVRPHFEIVLFTAATQNWAAAAIEQLDPSCYLFDVMLHRDHTTSDLMWDYVKDLSRLGRDLARVVIVDDNPLMFMYQPDNALHIGAYEAAAAGGPDNVLERVAEVLINQVAVAEDVREVLSPMAASKSCITSTISAVTAATSAEAQAAPCNQAAACPDADATGASVGEGSAAAAGAGPDAVACDETLGDWGQGAYSEDDASTDAEGEDDAEADAEGEEGAPETDNSDGSDSSDATADECDKGSTGLDWELESEGADGTFDEHGAAAQLGAGEAEGAADCGRDSEAAPAGAAGSSECGAPAKAEEQDAEGDEFDALMDDAIAEYDSDAYDDAPYGDDAEGPAATAAVCAPPPVAACASAESGCCPRSCSLRTVSAGSDGASQLKASCEAAAASCHPAPLLTARSSVAAVASCAAAGGEEPAGVLPSGMVFLTDLNPALADGSEEAAGASGEAAAAGAVSCKRSREQDGDGGLLPSASRRRVEVAEGAICRGAADGSH